MLNKIKQLKADGISKIHIIADFDRTLTVSTTKSGKANSCYAILREEKYLSSDYPEKAHALFDKYYPYEISQDITEQERDEKMNEWFNEHFHLFKQSGLTKSVFKDIILKKHIQLRDGARELLELSNQHNVPLLIFSAGMGNLIQ